jgi:hypothetical protein
MEGTRFARGDAEDADRKDHKEAELLRASRRAAHAAQRVGAPFFLTASHPV